MTIREKAWKRYLEQLRKVNDKATESILYYLQEFGMPESPEAMDDLIYAAWNISTKYGEAAAELAAEMYDSMAELSGKYVPPALPAPTPTRDEVAHAILGTVDTGTKETVAAAVGRQVKMTGVDTTMQNALRDGAEWAWIPAGETCAFCLTLASRGWQRASKKAIRNGHAQHIHANCDCTYAVRLDGKSTVAGYDPEKLKAEYDAHNGDISAWQRDLDAPRREEINARKRELYAEKKDMEFPSIREEYRRTATPGKGTVKIPENREKKNREEENLYLLYSQLGGNITMPVEVHDNGKKNPDYLWRGKLWEEQEPSAYTRNAVDKNIREAIHQIAENPGGIVLDIGASDMPTDEVMEIALRRLRRSAAFDCDLILIRKGTIEDIRGYRKTKK